MESEAGETERNSGGKGGGSGEVRIKIRWGGEKRGGGGEYSRVT